MYIGLDIGTSGTKAALIDQKGTVLGVYQVNYGFSNTRGGYRELNAGQVWEAAKKCLLEVGKKGKARSITVSSLGEAIVAIDEEGRPLADGITGTDIRGEEELEELTRQFGSRKLTDITGLNLSTIYSANKILWMKRHRKELYEKSWKILTFQDYIIYRLCKRAVIDYSMASRTLLFDINRNGWSGELLEWTEISAQKLAEAVPAGTVAGTILPSLAKELGLSGDIKVVAGTHDHICNAIGSGVCEAGSCADTVGTTEGMTAVLERSWLSSEHIEECQISCEPFAVSGLFNTVAWNNTSGVLLKWFVNQFVKEEDPADILHTFEKMNRQMQKEPTDLLVLPHFSGAATPYMDSRSRGAVLGLTLDTKREDVYKALMEGANYELALILEGLERAGLEPRKIVATGGALSPELLQIKADVLGLPVHTVKNRQTGTLGGAILGAVALGMYSSIAEAVSHMVEEDVAYQPDETRHEIYKEKLKNYKNIYPAIAEISHNIVK